MTDVRVCKKIEKEIYRCAAEWAANQTTARPGDVFL